MEENKEQEKLEKIIQFKKHNISVLLEWKKLIDDAREAIFKANCLKSYLTECEPWYCSFRITGSCKYPDEISKLEKLIKIE